MSDAAADRDVVDVNKRFYDGAFADVYDNYHLNSVKTHYSQRLFAQILRLTGLGSAGKISVLDVGCGTGSYSRGFLEVFPGCLLTASDVSRKMLDAFRQKLSGGEAARTEFACAEAADILGAGRQYDIVATEETLHHLPSYETIVGKMADAVKPGGFIFIFNEPLKRASRLAVLTRAIDIALLKAVTFDYSTPMRRVIMFPGYGASKFFRDRHPKEYAVMKNKVRGYGFSKDDMADYIRSEHQKGGIDRDLILRILESKGFTVTADRAGADYKFYYPYWLSTKIGHSHFILLARKSG
jgi:2-polyprenyl-3-methyl-5-hydroxy-6-metoxy-1,4-benzoquinol methylase